MKTETRKQKAEGRKQQTECCERTRTKGHRLGFWLVAGLALMVGMASPSYGRSHGSVATGLGPTITLRVYNYARIAPSLLNRSVEEAATIFAKAGIETSWIDCPVSPAEIDRFPACQSEPTSSDFILHILSGAMTIKIAAHAEALGSARACPENAMGCSAQLFYSRALGLAPGEISDYQALGHAMAHEIGHLLLGANTHSEKGIMRGEWSPDDLKVMAVSFLLFTPSQAERMQGALRARASTQQALEAKTVSK